MSVLVELAAYVSVGTLYWWWGQNLPVFGLVPNFIFAAALAAAILAGPVKGMAWGFFLGLYADMLGSSMLGGYALTYTLLAYSVYVFKRHFDMDGFFPQVVASVALSWGCMFFYRLLAIAFSSPGSIDWKVFFAEPFINALVVPVFFQIFYRLKRSFGAI